jgi:hypothetical protein
MVHSNTANGAPCEIRSFKAIDEPHDIVCATSSLPVEKFFRRHFLIPA